MLGRVGRGSPLSVACSAACSRACVACTGQGTLFERALEPWLRDQRRALAYVDKIFDASVKRDRDKCLQTYEDFMRSGTDIVESEYIDHQSVCRCTSSCASKFCAADPCSFLTNTH